MQKSMTKQHVYNMMGYKTTLYLLVLATNNLHWRIEDYKTIACLES